MVDRFQLEVHAYVLMKNHHLLIRTRIGDLSRSIQWLGLAIRYGLTGATAQRPSFPGTFQEFYPQENDGYFTAMCLYVHGNQ
jgi:hypothetical protein